MNQLQLAKTALVGEGRRLGALNLPTNLSCCYFFLASSNRPNRSGTWKVSANGHAKGATVVLL